MAKWLLIALALIIGAQPVTALEVVPVEVHMNTGDALYMYDCYPLSAVSPKEFEMLVYVNSGDGIAGYGCDYGGGAWIRPFAPRSTNIPIKYVTQ